MPPPPGGMIRFGTLNGSLPAKGSKSDLPTFENPPKGSTSGTGLLQGPLLPAGSSTRIDLASRWEEFVAKKPSEGKNHPDDEKLLAETKDSIGDYKLKESDDYKVAHHLKDTTQYHIRHQFSQKVWNLREKKYQVRDHLLEQRQLLLKINEELPQSLRKLGPDVPEVDPTEFPEKKLIPNVEVPEESVFEENAVDEQEFVPTPNSDMQERELMPETIFPIIEGTRFRSTIDQLTVDSVSSMPIKSLLAMPDDRDTPYEMDVKARRLTRELVTIV
ncbi:hypothetical protein NQ318_010956 [Aromia moschata]|uniref:Uncharacterized protein n=1 Tax=Aromia moschata TaxID=1265417 RepID=A0AAV8YNI7_9CUCU|nr:hypothetical protein NQ318_010956 [Aromia moschata]